MPYNHTNKCLDLIRIKIVYILVLLGSHLLILVLATIDTKSIGDLADFDNINAFHSL